MILFKSKNAYLILQNIRRITHDSFLKNPSVLKDTLEDLKNMMDSALEDTTTIEQLTRVESLKRGSDLTDKTYVECRLKLQKNVMRDIENAFKRFSELESDVLQPYFNNGHIEREIRDHGRLDNQLTFYVLQQFEKVVPRFNSTIQRLHVMNERIKNDINVCELTLKKYQ